MSAASDVQLFDEAAFDQMLDDFYAGNCSPKEEHQVGQCLPMPSHSPPVSQLSFEERRQRNIARNNSVLQNMGLLDPQELMRTEQLTQREKRHRSVSSHVSPTLRASTLRERTLREQSSVREQSSLRRTRSSVVTRVVQTRSKFNFSQQPGTSLSRIVRNHAMQASKEAQQELHASLTSSDAAFAARTLTAAANDDDDEWRNDDNDDEDDEFDEDSGSTRKRKQTRKLQKTGVSAAPDCVQPVSLPGDFPAVSWDRMLVSTPAMSTVAFFLRPSSYETCRRLIVDEFGGACGNPLYAATEQLYLSLDLAWEMSRYFQGAMRGTRQELESAMFAAGGRLLQGRRVPSKFAIGYTGNATTFVFEQDIASYLFKRFRTFTEDELRSSPDRLNARGNASVLNFGMCYVADRPFPDCKAKQMVDRLCGGGGAGLVRDALTGFAHFGVSSEQNLCKVVTADVWSLLQPERDFANVLNERRAKEKAKIDETPAHKRADVTRRCRYFRRYVYSVPMIAEAKDIPAAYEELAACVVFDATGNILLFPVSLSPRNSKDHRKRQEDNLPVKFVRERPSTEFPFVTVSVPGR